MGSVGRENESWCRDMVSQYAMSDRVSLSSGTAEQRGLSNLVLLGVIHIEGDSVACIHEVQSKGPRAERMVLDWMPTRMWGFHRCESRWRPHENLVRNVPYREFTHPLNPLFEV